MILEHRGRSPQIDPTAYVAPTAVVCGDVHVGPDARILFGAVVTAEDGRVEIGARCVVMENAVLRGRAAHPLTLGDDVLVGPHAHLNGAQVGDGCFLATGCALFPGSRLGPGAEVRIHGVVHVNSTLAPGAVVPIGWVAVGEDVFPPGAHDAIWAVQEGLDFPGTVYALPRDAPARERMERQAAWFDAHRDDTAAWRNSITPVLTVRGAAEAVAFYARAFGAEEVHRNTYPDGRIVAEMAIGEARFRVADEAPEAANLSPQALGGTAVRLNLLVADPDALAERAVAAGAAQIAPVADQAYGLRQGRLADPYGHHWLIGTPLAGEAGDWARA